MADVKITALTAISSNPVNPATFPIPMVDLLDNTITASGTTKKVTVNQILGAGGTATLASATITGDLTVDTSTLKVDSTLNRVGVGTASPGKRCEINQSANAITTIGAGEILRLIGDDGNVVSRITEVGFGSGPTGATYAPVVIGAVNTSISGFGTKDFYVATRAGISDVAPLERYRIDSTGISTWSVSGTTAMTLNSTGLLIGGSTNTTSAKLVAQAGTSNAVQYSIIELRGGSSSGTNQIGLIRRQTTAAVSNSAATIYGTCTYGELVVVTGVGGGAIFADLLMVSFNTVSVISSNTQQGSPAARTYAISTGNLQLTMGSATSMAITSQAFTAGGLGA